MIFETIIVIFLLAILYFVIAHRLIRKIPKPVMMFFGIIFIAVLIPLIISYYNVLISAPVNTSSPAQKLTDMVTPYPAHEIMDCKEQTDIETESLRVHIGIDKKEIKIHENTFIHLTITSKENEKNLVIIPVIPQSGFSVLNPPMKSTLEPHKPLEIQTEIIANEAKEGPLNVYIQYENIKSVSKEANVSLCIRFK